MEAIVNEQLRTGPVGQSTPIGEPRSFSQIEIDQVVERLKEPFDPRVVQWVVKPPPVVKTGTAGVFWQVTRTRVRTWTG